MLNEVRKSLANHKRLTELDRELVAALYAPAIADFAVDGDDCPWLEEEWPEQVDDLLSTLLQVSEFYASRNPVLSASLWGIWNASSYLRRQRPILAIFLESRKKRRKQFMHVRGLVATAVVQFSDGVAQTRLTSNALSDMASYEQAVQEAKAQLGSNVE